MCSPKRLWKELMDEYPSETQLKLMYGFLSQNRTDDIVEQRAKKLMEDIEKKIYSGGWTGNVRTQVAGLLGDASQTATAGAAVLTGRDFLAMRVAILQVLGKSGLTDPQTLKKVSRMSARMAATRTGSELRGKLPIGDRSLLAGGVSVYGVDRQAVAPIPRIEVPEITQPTSEALIKSKATATALNDFYAQLRERGVPDQEISRQWRARQTIDFEREIAAQPR